MMNVQPSRCLKFCPTEEQLVRECLLPKVTNNPLLADEYVQECDLYGEKPPWEIFGFSHVKQSTFYCFTRLRKKAHNGSRYIRTAGRGGTWKLQNGDNVADGEGRNIGVKRSLTYMSKEIKDKNGVGAVIGRWVMKEYSLKDGIYSGNELPGFEDYVVCRITNYVKINCKNDGLSGDLASIALQESPSGSNHSPNSPDSEIGNPVEPLSVNNRVPVHAQQPYVNEADMADVSSSGANCSSDYESIVLGANGEFVMINGKIPSPVAGEPQAPVMDDLSVFSGCPLPDSSDYFPCQLTNTIGDDGKHDHDDMDDVPTTTTVASIPGFPTSQPFVAAPSPIPLMDQSPIQPREQHSDDFFDELADMISLPSFDGNIDDSSIAMFQEPRFHPYTNGVLDLAPVFVDTPSL